MANKTAEKISPDAFLNEMNAINDKAKDAVVDLLNKQGNKCYIAVPDWEDECEGDDGDGTKVSIFGIGLDDDDEICIAAVVDNIGYGHGPDDFPQEWTKATELWKPDYCAFYRFVANNIDKAMTKEEADELADKYWNGNCCDYGKYDWHDDCICNGLIKVRLDGKYGFINKDGEEIIPCKYEDADAFSDGLAKVKSAEGWGFVNENGEEIVACKYEEAHAFWLGLAKVKSAKGWGFVNKNGEEIIPCKYEKAYAFEGGLSLVKSKEGYGFVNNEGEEIIPCKYEDAHGFLFGANTAEVKLNGEWINIDKTGKQVTEENW